MGRDDLEWIELNNLQLGYLGTFGSHEFKMHWKGQLSREIAQNLAMDENYDLDALECEEDHNTPIDTECLKLNALIVKFSIITSEK